MTGAPIDNAFALVFEHDNFFGRALHQPLQLPFVICHQRRTDLNISSVANEQHLRYRLLGSISPSRHV